MNSHIQTIAICCSASFFKEVFGVSALLKERGYNVEVPVTALRMEKADDFNVERYKTWFENPDDYGKKADLIRNHFKKVVDSDAILVLNYPKHDISGYIGGNTLMEMAIAFHYEKRIYVLHPVLESSPFYEEILGMHPIFLEGDIRNL